MNAIVTIATFLFLRNFQLNIFYSLAYSILFSVLAYSSSGTPFVDHHSSFFSLLAIYSLILAIKNEKGIYWTLFPIFFGLAFFSKQTPASYIIIGTIIILCVFSISNKKFKWMSYSFVSTFAFILFLILFGKYYKISLSSFFDQYFFYPQTIGELRLDNFQFSYRGVIDHFKFIYIAFLPLLYINLKNIFFVKNYLKDNNFYYFLCIFVFSFSLIFHQLLTRNQTFIFFLIPILCAFSHISLKGYKLNLKSPIYILIISLCLFVTIKYHLRFNEGRKFHELIYVNFDLSVKGNEIDTKLSGLKWITPEFSENPNNEIILIKEAKSYLAKESRNKMVLTNYSIFSAILNERLHSPTRWHLPDGTDYPLNDSKYFNSYKNFFINILRKNDIKVIYNFNLSSDLVIYNYIDKACFDETKINEIFTKYEIINCKEING